MNVDKLSGTLQASLQANKTVYMYVLTACYTMHVNMRNRHKGRGHPGLRLTFNSVSDIASAVQP